MTERILLFIPMYNCENQIVRVLDQLKGEILEYISEVIIVNNRSTDNGEQAVITYLENATGLPPVHLLRNQENYGLGGSHKVAFQYAIDHQFDYVIVLHGDDQGRVSDFLPLLKNRKFLEYDCCLGARFMRGSKLQGYSPIRIGGNLIFNCFFSCVVGRKIYDLGSGLNMYKISSLQTKYYEKYPDTLYFNDCMILAFCYYQQKILFYPISWREEDQVSNNKIIKFAFSLLQMLYKYMINKEKFLSSDMRNKKILEYHAEMIL